MKDFFHFDNMITPRIITFVYWIMLFGIGLAALVSMVGAFGTMQYSVMAGLGTLFIVPIAAGFGMLVARMYCEILIVLFKMNETLQQIRDK